MRIPQLLASYTKPTLLVVADGTRAFFFSLFESSVEPAGEITISYPPKENVERTSIRTPSGMHSAEQSENLRIEKERRLAHMLAQELLKRLQQKKYKELIITAPHEYLNEFVEVLHPHVRACLIRTIPKLLTKEPIMKILERI